MFSTGTNRLIKKSRIDYWLLRKILPSQFYESDQRGVAVYFPLYKTLIYSLAGYLPGNPWWSGCSFATRLLVLSEAHKLAYPQELSKHIVPTGQLSLDKLYRSFSQKNQIRSRLLDKYTDTCGKDTPRLIFIALPQFWEHGIFSKEKSDQIITDILLLCLR